MKTKQNILSHTRIANLRLTVPGTEGMEQSILVLQVKNGTITLKYSLVVSSKMKGMHTLTQQFYIGYLPRKANIYIYIKS